MPSKKTIRKSVQVADLAPARAGVKGGVLIGLLLPAVQKVR